MVCSTHRGSGGSARYLGAYIVPVNVSRLCAGISQGKEGYVSS